MDIKLTTLGWWPYKNEKSNSGERDRTNTNNDSSTPTNNNNSNNNNNNNNNLNNLNNDNNTNNNNNGENNNGVLQSFGTKVQNGWSSISAASILKPTTTPLSSVVATRPQHLPTKSEEETNKHLKDYTDMMKNYKKKGEEKKQKLHTLLKNTSF